MPDKMKHDSETYLEQHGARIIRDGSRLCLVYLAGVSRRKRTRDLECHDPIAGAIEAAEWLRAYIAREEAGGRFERAKA